MAGYIAARMYVSTDPVWHVSSHSSETSRRLLTPFYFSFAFRDLNDILNHILCSAAYNVSQYSERQICSGYLQCYTNHLVGGTSWWRGPVVERRSLAGELSLYARPAADG